MMRSASRLEIQRIHVDLDKLQQRIKKIRKRRNKSNEFMYRSVTVLIYTIVGSRCLTRIGDYQEASISARGIRQRKWWGEGVILVLSISMAIGVVAEGGRDAPSLSGFIKNAGKPVWSTHCLDFCARM
jgi:hypothetical protein